MSALGIGLVSVAVLLAVLEVNRVQPDPYMDEIFHYRQTRAYCDRRWSYWDPSLTTPPGSYIVPLITTICLDITQIRLLNTIWFVVAAALIRRLLLLERRRASPTSSGGGCESLRLISLLTHPVLLFHTLLYYTDIPSLAMAMATLLAMRSRYLNLGALLGAISVMFRQTNLIWLMFACLDQVVLDLGDPASLDAALVKRCLGQIRPVLYRYRYSVLVGLGAVALVIVNGGSVVLGDRQNHSARLHLVQLLYFAAYACLGTFPGPMRGPGAAGAVLAPALALAVQRTTYAHPFIVSDNRHYTFYVWKNFFARYGAFRYGLIPVYMACLYTIKERFRLASRHVLWQSAYWLCVGLCLIPSPLIDMRYFLIPFVIFSIEDRSRSSADLCLNISINIVCNLVTVYIFLYRPFTWPDGSIARFMW